MTPRVNERSARYKNSSGMRRIPATEHKHAKNAPRALRLNLYAVCEDEDVRHS